MFSYCYNNYVKIIKEIATLLSSIGLVILVVNTPASVYLTQILALIVIISIIVILFKKRKNKEILSGSLIEVFGITTSIFLTIFLTDAVNSPLFFLLYFLLFGIAFLMEPYAVFIFLIGIMILFLPKMLPGIDITELARMGGLILISPIAYFFGREFQIREKLEIEVEQKTEKIIEEANDMKDTNILEDEKNGIAEEIIKDASELEKIAQNE